jgi:hypothetical protein
MKFSIVFDKSGDCIPFETVANEELLQFFVTKANNEGRNSFSDQHFVHRHLDRLVTECHWALSKTNEVLYDLCGFSFPQEQTLIDYVDQTRLNQQHALWVKSQQCMIDIHRLFCSSDHRQAALGKLLHEQYPDSITQVSLAEALTKLGYIFAYEQVNMTVHQLESFFAKNIEFKADTKWEVFDNPYQHSMVSNNDTVNFCFGYTYVGRQYYNKWQYFDTELKFDDHYNYETLEWAFNISLGRPQTIAYSSEFLAWCTEKNIPPITTQLPIANVVDLDKNLSYYRRMLYKNSLSGNQAKLEIH